MRSSHDGQTIENLHITANGIPAIVVTHSNVTIRNVRIDHVAGAGIAFSNADGLTIDGVSIEARPGLATEAQPSAPNIQGDDARNVQIVRARLRGGSSGVYLLRCRGARLRLIEGYDFRGPYPRGQFVQFDKCDDVLLDEFSVLNSSASFPEDNVSVFRSRNVTIRRGLIIGNNSRTGVGVMFERGSDDGLVEDVDAVSMGNGCFSAYDVSRVIFRRTRCTANICTDQGRGPPASKGLMWVARNNEEPCCVIEDSRYDRPCDFNNIVWPRKMFSRLELHRAEFAHRQPIRNRYCWE